MSASPDALPAAARSGPRSRDQVLGTTESRYSLARHVGGLVFFAALALAIPAWGLRGVTAAEVALAPAAFLFANFFEWALHRYIMHAPRPPRVMYDRHTLKHHVAFTPERMAIGCARDLRWVLMPTFALPGMVAATAPVAAALALLWSGNAARVFLIVAVSYYVLYELLHTAYHLPETSAIGRTRLIRALRRHHTAHHDPRAMADVNFNITFPIADLVLGTYRRTRT